MDINLNVSNSMKWNAFEELTENEYHSVHEIRFGSYPTAYGHSYLGVRDEDHSLDTVRFEVPELPRPLVGPVIVASLARRASHLEEPRRKKSRGSEEPSFLKYILRSGRILVTNISKFREISVLDGCSQM